ncbi:MAG: ribonuclease Y [Candidatus Harrisonbacteria bacterium CG10_big_fil_rev_8_21_14_0_10_40_38]|uniref:Ribonuclease Y n=1 Tax=Candidatus Harrisonbacteria bacterium CG10_big_fil_rev_8_21_14_0_10_40_38 TaxID=1974583 RepID=A0A2H0URG8_9BACT|nr:MAG: ribonuclease Y [Candidatus Harrisonbacteria bacterium CG10_big_fil_rev_8_21_14_0_10_40_38]
MSENIFPILGALLVGLLVGYVIRRIAVGQRASSIEQKLKLQVEEAKQNAQAVLLEAKEKAAVFLDDAKKEEKERQQQLDKLADRLIKREELIEQQVRQVSSKEEHLEGELAKLAKLKTETEEKQSKLAGELERITGLSLEDAKKELFSKIEDEYKQELPSLVQKLEKERRDEIEKRSQEIITTAIQRYARTHVAEITTSVFHLPNEDLKGKIIGREGRNIRALERLTGVEIIVDEAPDSIVLSSFDPLRREIARMTLEKLIKDGRIQPAKIEEKVEESRQELTKRMQAIGEQAALEVGVVGLSKELLQLLGRLHFRTSYGQNVLVHSVEMAHISAMIAAELGANIEVAKKGALLHDIGKAISHEVEGTHVELGRKLLKKYSVEEPVIRAMESHHEDYPFSTPESYIVAAADVLSAARPGARRDTVESYIKRLEELEKIVNQFDGVRNSYALSAGREVRVFVVPEKIDDFRALQLAKDIAAKIQSEMKYPGEIKVNVIRELRAVEFAR